ncbi:hypothetical protein [Myroides odoratimimus]|uniref:Uncharacterized protein n=1 Tax=Myroides odoratimimus CIP 101113 TaxID=883154 RepID=A0AAV3F5D1_9FLAO|nr:hypothetical protein [Myroides odoratimimus]EHO13853.1 hypothetical protein HMPREF9715_00927 [Myroides odoratimimus CIP 101113]
MSDVVFPISIIDKVNSPEREKLLSFLDPSKKLEADEVNLLRDAINELYLMVEKAGLYRQKAEPTTRPTPTGFWIYSVSTPGKYIYFIDKEGNAIDVYANDLSKGIVEIWVNNGVAEKVIQHINIEEQIEDIIGQDDLQIFIESSKGYLLLADNLNTTLTPTVQRMFKDLSDKVTSWQWFRESGYTQEDKDSDELWALGKNQRILSLATEDFTLNVYDHSITFICQAIVDNKKIKQSLTFN